MVHPGRLLVFILPFLLAVPSWAADGPVVGLAGLAGEKLEFRLRWGVIPAGKASLEVIAEGGGRYRLRAKARSLPYIDTVYPVRDRIESTVHEPGFRVTRYFKRAKEGWGHPREVEVLFGPDGVARRFKNGDKKKEILVPPGIQDPLSCFYAYRTRPGEGDETVRLDITDGKKLVTGRVVVLDRKRVATPAGTFDTVRIEPIIEGIGGVFKKSPGARIFVWLTDDARRMPVKLQSKVVVGSFTAELVEVRPPGTGPRSGL